MGLALAAAGSQAGPGVLGLDAVPEPVGAPRRARLVPQRLGQPRRMCPLRVGVGLVAVADLLGEVLGQVADAPARVFRSGEHALGVEPDPVPRLIVQADGVERLVPGRQDFPGGRVEVAADALVPDRQLVAVVLDLAGVGPPDLVIGGGPGPITSVTAEAEGAGR